MRFLTVLLAVLVGVAAIVVGALDDAPGLQVLGLLVVLVAALLGLRSVLRSRRAR